MSLLKRLEKENMSILSVPHNKKVESNTRPDAFRSIKDSIQNRLIKQTDFENLDKDLVEEKIGEIFDEILKENSTFYPFNKDRQRLINETLNEAIAFGPITAFVQDDEITEIMVNGCQSVYIERNGKLEKTDIAFRDDNQVVQVIERIVSPLGRRIDESSPMVDARIPDGSRVNAIIPPLAIDGPVLTIRKFSKDPFTIDDLINFGTLTPQIAAFLKLCVKGRLNIVVSGGTGSGKTTTLNVLSAFIPPDERIITIEDAAELQLRQEHVVRLETRPPNIEGKGMVVVRDLVRNALRMRPDRIIVGEVRTGEALDMLQAMNTGHDGSLTTGHSNSPRDMLSRLETMVLMAGMEIPMKAIREQIASAIDLIVHQSRYKDGSRKITQITEVQGMEGDVITLQDIFAYKHKGKDDKGRLTGEFVYTGIKPRLLGKLEEYGILNAGELLK